jgi:hypothetical protein
MYGPSKDDGGLIGLVQADENDGSPGADATMMQDSTRAEETLLGVAHDEDTGEEVRVCWRARINPESGDLEWVMGRGEEAVREVHERTMAMSLMTSMLRDDRRNTVYESAIKVLIHNFITKAGCSPLVLDIGSGTSLLSLLCASNNASVIGCEMFDAMAAVGQDVVSRNGFDDRISIAPCKSTELSQLFDLERMPDLLVSELLDSALLGESCIHSHASAIASTLNHGIPDPRALGLNSSVEFDPDELPVADRVLPHNARINVSLVESNLVHDIVNTNNIGMLDINIYRDDTFAPHCSASRPLIPVHWEVFHRQGGRTLSDSVPILNVDFFKGLNTGSSSADVSATDETPKPFQFADLCDTNTIDILVTSAGVVHGILLWWDLYLLSPALDPQRTYMYSTHPPMHTVTSSNWSGGVSNSSSVESDGNWQDHWVQCVWPLPTPLQCTDGDTVRVTITRDFINISFSATKINGVDEVAAKRKRLANEVEDDDTSQPDAAEVSCQCGWHMLCGAERLQMLSDSRRKSVYELSIRRACHYLSHTYGGKCEKGKALVFLDVGDGSLLSLAAAKLLSHDNVSVKIISAEKKDYSRLLHAQLIDSNGLNEIMDVWDGQDIDEFCQLVGSLSTNEESGDPTADTSYHGDTEIVALVSECFQYQLSSLPTWQALSFWYTRSSSPITSLLSKNALIFPRQARVMVAAVHLPDLHLNHGQLGSIKGFDHSAFDEKIDSWHTHYYPYKLGNYKKQLLSEPICVACIDYRFVAADVNSAVFRVPVRSSKENQQIDCHCVAVWVDYVLIGEEDEVDASKSNDHFQYILSQCIDDDFALYYACQIKFFPSPVPIGGDLEQAFLTCHSSFTLGDSDIRLNFNVEYDGN